jgi:low affinity Fe/Cu permease
MNDWFRKFAQRTSAIVGSPIAFVTSVFIILIWAFLGPNFNYSDTWQLVINTGTTIITFLMVFLIQNTQNRDARAIHLKLDELIRATKNARNRLIDLQNLSEQDLDKLHDELCSQKEVTEQTLNQITTYKEKIKKAPKPKQP